MSRFLSAALCALFVCSVSATDASASGNAKAGKGLFDTNCTMCHGKTSPIAGSPKIGDKAAWKSRIAQGEKTLVQHAISGFKTPGTAANAMSMPARGGKATLSDADIANIVAYMVSESK